MAFCANCGAPVEGKFCATCGTAVGSAPSSGSGAPTPGSGAVGSSDLAPNLAGTLCYIPVLIPAILFLVLAPYNQNKSIRFHALQALFLQIAWVVVILVLGTVAVVSSWFWSALIQLLWLCYIGLLIFMMYKTYQQQKVSLPVIGELAEKHA